MVLVNITKKLLAKALRVSMKELQRGPHITRYYMYRHLSQYKQTPQKEAKVISISHSKSICEVLGLEKSHIVEANYPEYNMLSLPFGDNSFDYVLSDQVLEHIEGDPKTAIDETLRILKPGGLAIHTTCFINPIHGYPSDFWRFTPDALKLLCRGFSNIIEVGGWGNPYVWLIIGLGLRFDGVPESSWHPLHKLAMHNDDRWPIVTWIIAEK